MRNLLLSVVMALVGFLPANAQLSFTISVEYYGACRNEAQKIADSYLNQYTQLASGIPTSSDCERLRNIVNGINYSYGSGKTLCGVRLKAGPCTGRALTNDVGYNDIRISNINGVSQGSSFYSTNPANEIKNWSDDDIARLIAFNKLYQSVYDEFGIITGDSDFDNARRNKDDYEFTGRMPEGSVGLISNRRGDHGTLVEQNEYYFGEVLRPNDERWAYLLEKENTHELDTEYTIPDYEDYNEMNFYADLSEDILHTALDIAEATGALAGATTVAGAIGTAVLADFAISLIVEDGVALYKWIATGEETSTKDIFINTLNRASFGLTTVTKEGLEEALVKDGWLMKENQKLFGAAGSIALRTIHYGEKLYDKLKE